MLIVRRENKTTSGEIDFAEPKVPAGIIRLAQ